MLAELLTVAVSLVSPATIHNGDRYGTVILPSIQESEVIREDALDHDVLDHGVGHFKGYSWPGEGGLIPLWGHRITPVNGRDHGPFYYIDRLDSGDKILIRSHFGVTYTYVVTRHKIIHIDEVETFRARDHELLTLAACAHEDGTPGGADWRYVVFAKPVVS